MNNKAVNIGEFTNQARAMADPTRIRMLKLLEDGELCVCHIVEILGLVQSTASKHLGILKAAGLVESRKNGTWSYFRLAETERAYNMAFLQFLASRLDADETVKSDRRRLGKKMMQPCK
ncbi:MAG: metalloregulator ArsR/SmtB family transcription factor [Nitrospiraceae bacterium]|nr:metalloregulator ArsR/SmtB family transcription factor [Nitrospiraceae bacterium]